MPVQLLGEVPNWNVKLVTVPAAAIEEELKDGMPWQLASTSCHSTNSSSCASTQVSCPQVNPGRNKKAHKSRILKKQTRESMDKESTPKSPHNQNQCGDIA